MNKEAIELLEKARSVARVAEPNKAGYECIEQHIDQALTLLKQQPTAPDSCKTCMCMDCGKVIKVTEQSKHLKECPREPKCKTCGDTKEIQQRPKIKDLGDGAVSWDARPIPCPDCQQPTAGEFTKKIYEKWSPAPKHTKDPRLTLALIDLLEACNRLDRAEAIIKDLRKGCIIGLEIHRIYFATLKRLKAVHELGDENYLIIEEGARKVEAAIAKAKKVGG